MPSVVPADDPDSAASVPSPPVSWNSGVWGREPKIFNLGSEKGSGPDSVAFRDDSLAVADVLESLGCLVAAVSSLCCSPVNASCT